ncbi:phospholipase-like, Aminotransferase-like mobile domain protein [Artemisia annua]|uniref:Phospholipase-like, Aminotransferase-like mobile domain protein n=1 Tax=Artemisia annua TaxID=35608 RepID=A0A2U1PYS4_ARTAN|nr:phospholipase-like, Aminotransferase-like mobile domain protein [Artemisia annua]
MKCLFKPLVDCLSLSVKFGLVSALHSFNPLIGECISFMSSLVNSFNPLIALYHMSFYASALCPFGLVSALHSFNPLIGECLIFWESVVKVHIRSKLHYFQLIKDRLSENRRKLFRSTCFGPWLDLNYFENDESLIHYMLQNQIKSDDAHYDLPLIYDVNGHHLHFGRRQFHLITGFKFGMPSFRKFRTGDIIFRDRVFPEKVGVNLKAIDLLCLIEEDEYFIKLSDEDAVRVCLLLSAQVIFMGREMLSVVDDVYLRMVENFENWNDFHWGEHIWRQLYDAIRNTYSKQKLEYSLAGFVFAFKIWILEVSTQSLRWWSKKLDLIPRALSWSKKAKEINQDLYPTRAESDTEWYTKSIRFFNWYAPRPAPAVNRGGLFEDYLCKRAALRAKIHAIDNEVPAPQASYTLQDRVRTLQGICNGFMLLPAEVNSLRSQVHKLETYIQYIMRKIKAGHRQDKLHRVDENEQRLDKLHNVVEKEHKEPEKVFIPINEPKKHWSVAQFHIQSGLIIFYDSVYRCEEEGREWYLKMRNCLEVNLPLILQETGVFDKKRINPENYKIRFRLAQNVPKQGGVSSRPCFFLAITSFDRGLSYIIPT